MAKKYVVKTSYLNDDGEIRGGSAFFDTPEEARSFYDETEKFLEGSKTTLSKDIIEV